MEYPNFMFPVHNPMGAVLDWPVFKSARAAYFDIKEKLKPKEYQLVEFLRSLDEQADQ